MKNILFITAIFCSIFFFTREIKAQELVLNGNLESWVDPATPTSWAVFENITQESGTTHGGTYSAKHTSDPATKKFQQNLSGVIPGSLYTLSYWFLDNDPMARTRIWCYWLSAGNTLPDNQVELRPDIYSEDNPSWIQVTYALTAPPTADGFRFEVRVYKQDNVPGGSVFYDDFSFATGGTPLPEPTNYPSDFFASANNLSIDLIWTDAEGGQLPQAYLIKASEANDIVAPVDGVAEADDLDFADGKGVKNVLQGAQAYSFINLKPDKQYYFKIYPYTNGGANINYKTDGTPPSATATTANITMILFKDFANQLFDPWDTISLSSDKGWLISSYGGNYYAYINGYQASAECNEWLISPSMNFDTYKNETLSFRTASNYTGPVLEVKMSTNYVTGADPTTATWTPITATLSSGAWTWTASGNIDVSSFSGDNVHLAFRYITALPDASAWEVDDIIITGVLDVGVPETEAVRRSYTIVPNPSDGRFNLVFNENSQKEVRILSVVGQEVYRSTTNQTTLSVDIPNLSAGIYFIRVNSSDSGKTEVKKLIVR